MEGVAETKQLQQSSSKAGKVAAGAAVVTEAEAVAAVDNILGNYYVSRDNLSSLVCVGSPSP